MRRFLADEPYEGLPAIAGFHELTRCERVVLNHVSNICAKLAVFTRPELVIEARNAGFGVE